MNVDPKQINNLIKIFCELDEEYRGKALMEMNQQTLLHNPIKDLNCMRLLLSLENCRDTKIISCLIV